MAALYATGKPHWTLVDPSVTDPAELSTLGAVEVDQSELPADPATYQITGSVLFDVDGSPTLQYSFVGVV